MNLKRSQRSLKVICLSEGRSQVKQAPFSYHGDDPVPGQTPLLILSLLSQEFVRRVQRGGPGL